MMNDLWRKVAIWPAIGANPRTGGAFPHLTALEPRCLALVSSARPIYSYLIIIIIFRLLVFHYLSDYQLFIEVFVC